MPLLETVLRSFQEVARHGSVRRAAEHLHVTASAIDRQILKLEQEMGVALFERQSRGMRLTAAGEVLLVSTRKLQREVQSATAQIDALRGLRRGAASVMGLQFLAETLLPEVLTNLRRTHPQISYAAHTGTSGAITKAVIDGDADIGICHSPPAGLPLTIELAVPMRLGVVFAPRHPLATAGAPDAPVRMRDCLAYPLVLPQTGMELRALIDAARPRTMPAFQPAVETNSMVLLKSLLVRGAGIGFLSNADVAQETRAGTLHYRSIKDSQATAQSLCLITRSGRVLPVAVQLFMAAVQPALQALLPA